MVRRRTATLSATAVALVLAAPLVTSCDAAHPGTAAVVGGHAISVTELQSQVKQVRAAQNRTGQAEQMISATSGLDRTTLGSMVFNRVLDRAAADAGATVHRGDVQNLESASAQQAGGTAALRSALLQQYGVAPGQVDSFFHTQAEAQALGRALGADLSTQQGQAVVTAALTKASHALKVDVNPRYGRWNDKTLSLADAPQPWLHGAAQAAPGAGLQ